MQKFFHHFDKIQLTAKILYYRTFVVYGISMCPCQCLKCYRHLFIINHVFTGTCNESVNMGKQLYYSINARERSLQSTSMGNTFEKH